VSELRDTLCATALREKYMGERIPEVWLNFEKTMMTYTNSATALCLKKTPPPDIFDCNLKTNYQILIIFGTNISDTTCHQMTIQFSTSPNVCFCTTWEKHFGLKNAAQLGSDILQLSF